MQSSHRRRSRPCSFSARRSTSLRTPCTGCVGGRARTSTTLRTPCNCGDGGRARISTPRRSPCTGRVGGRARISTPLRTPCTVCVGGRARKSTTRRTPCTGCVGGRASGGCSTDPSDVHIQCELLVMNMQASCFDHRACRGRVGNQTWRVLACCCSLPADRGGMDTRRGRCLAASRGYTTAPSARKMQPGQ